MINMNDWEQFLAGHWQMEIPNRAGSYRVATIDGQEAGERAVYWDELEHQFRVHGEWGGWYWSAPTPELVPVPVMR